MTSITLSDGEFLVFQKLIYNEIGIALGPNKKVLIETRLHRRLVHYNLSTFSEYLRLVQINSHEKTQMLNLITTNETYFFREPRHFEFLEHEVLPRIPFGECCRVWSAAASVGAEAYTIAMVLDSHYPTRNWEVIGSDINTEVLQKARIGLYPSKWAEKIPGDYLKKYCLKGKGAHEGMFLIDRSLLEHVRFFEANLLLPVSHFGEFNVIFLRNVLLYFDTEMKQKVLDNAIANLKKGGYLFISHTENLNLLKTDLLEPVQTSIFKKRS